MGPGHNTPPSSRSKVHGKLKICSKHPPPHPPPPIQRTFNAQKVWKAVRILLECILVQFILSNIAVPYIWRSFAIFDVSDIHSFIFLWWTKMLSSTCFDIIYIDTVFDDFCWKALFLSLFKTFYGFEFPLVFKEVMSKNMFLYLRHLRHKQYYIHNVISTIFDISDIHSITAHRCTWSIFNLFDMLYFTSSNYIVYHNSNYSN